MAVAAACGRSRQAADESESNTLTVLYPGGDERIVGPYWGASAQFLMFESLAELDSLGNLVGRLAKELEHSPDYREWTIHLRTDVRWHDGRPFTAHDVKFNIDLFKHPELLWKTPEVTASVVDDSTVRLVDPVDGGRLLLDRYQVWYPAHLLSDLDPADIYSWEFWKRPIGTGPFRYVRHVPNTMMEFEANPDYYRGQPRIDRLVLRFGGAPVTELLSGNVDAVGWSAAEDAALLGRGEEFNLYWEAWSTGRVILWKASRPVLSDARVRRAFAHAIDRRELIGILGLPDELPIWDGVVTEPQFRRGELPAPLEYDPDLARRLLEAAGWRDSDGDGVREREGEIARFEFVVSGEVSAIGVYIQDQLRRIGVQVEVATLATSVGRERLRSGEFEAILGHLGTGGLVRYLREGNPLEYRDEQLAGLVRQLETTVDPSERDRLSRQISTRIQTEQPATFLYPNAYSIIVHPRVRGLSSPWRADPLANLEHLWIEDPPE